MSAPWLRYRPASPASNLTIALAGFETPNEAERRSENRQRLLRRGRERALRLARKLAKCRHDERCGSPACTVCMRLVRRWFAGALIEAVLQAAETALFVTIVERLGRVPAGRLSSFRLKRFLATLRRRFLRDPLLREASFAFAGDVSYEEPARVWQFHLHGVALGITKPELKKALRRHFKPGTEIRRPISILPVANPVQQLSYVLKAFWKRRAHYISPAGRPTTNEYPLKGKQLRRLLLHFDRYSPTELLLLIGMRRDGPRLSRIVTAAKRKTGPPTQGRAR